MEHRFDVDRPQAIELGLGGLQDRAHMADAGVGDQYIASADSIAGCGGAAAARGIAEVHHVHHGLRPARGGEGRQARNITVDQHQPGLGQGEPPGDRGADARTGARDEDATPLQGEHGCHHRVSVWRPLSPSLRGCISVRAHQHLGASDNGLADFPSGWFPDSTSDQQAGKCLGQGIVAIISESGR